MAASRQFWFEHHVENGQQLARCGDQSHLGRFPGRAQAQIKQLEHGVAAHGGDGGNVKHPAQSRATAIDLALTTKPSAVAGGATGSR
jgi:hypothetical protein